jgi:hypothetical protein
MWDWMKEANQSGKYHLPREEGSVHITTLPGVMATNMVRLAIPDPTNIIELSKAEILGRRQALEYFRFMKDFLPGYENSVFLNFSTQIGVRETRRIIGEYTLTKEDVLSARNLRMPSYYVEHRSKIITIRQAPSGSIYRTQRLIKCLIAV